MQKFQKGDVVELKSGSAPMTVIDVDEHGFRTDTKGGITCQWFDKGDVRQRVFEPSALMPSSRSQSPSRSTSKGRRDFI